MSRQTSRGHTPPLHPTTSRQNPDQDNERESFLNFSTTPVDKRKHHQEDLHEDHHIHTRSNSGDPYRDSTMSIDSNPLSIHEEDEMAARAIGPFSKTTRSSRPAVLVAEHEEEEGLSSSSSSLLTSLEPPHEPSEVSHKPPAYSKWSTIGHQVCFLATGIFSTIAVQWLNYQGAASGTTMLNVFFNYIGMMSVGLVYAAQSWYADRNQRHQAMASKAARGTHVEYDVLLTNTDMNEMSELHGHEDEDEDGHGVKDHIELVGRKIRHSGGDSSDQLHVRTVHMEEQHHHHQDEEDDSDDSIDVEKQRLRMTTTKKTTTTITTTTSKGKMKKKDLSEDPKELEAVSKGGLHWPVIQVAVMDVVANALVTIGFFYVGSGMYQVIYSSIVIWCAILTRIFLGRKLNNIQWLAIVGVTLGLAISAVGTVQDVSPDDGPVQTWLEKSFGALVTLGATFLYACVYVLSDKVLSTFKPKPVPEKVCTLVGSYASLFTFGYLCFFTFPNWQREVVDVVHSRHGSWIGIILVYPLVTISSMLHSLNYYVLISRINSVAVGIMQSLRAVLVFVMSHYLFCSTSTTQCFNEWKFVSAIVVIGCVTLFSVSSSSTPAPSADSPIELHASGKARSGSPIPRLSTTQLGNASARAPLSP